MGASFLPTHLDGEKVGRPTVDPRVRRACQGARESPMRANLCTAFGRLAPTHSVQVRRKPQSPSGGTAL